MGGPVACSSGYHCHGNPADVRVISSRNNGQRASSHATPIAGQFVPETFANQIQEAFREPRLLVATDPRANHQSLTGAFYVSLPTIALYDSLYAMRLCHPRQQEGSSLSCPAVVDAGLGSILCMSDTSCCEHPWGEGCYT